MNQLEIEFFWPLTEQIKLDLDFKPCQDYEDQKRQQMWTNSTVTSGQYLIAGGGIDATTWATIDTNHTFAFKPHPDTVGYWEINKDLQIWRKERPNALHQKMTKVFFGWEWKDK